MEHAIHIILIGIGATLITDVWGWLRRPLTGMPPPDYALVGRWVGHLAHGRFRHARIAAAAPVRAERALGTAIHYLVGIAFAFLAIAFVGVDWIANPTLLPAVLVGAVTVLAPFLILQPAMGGGWFANRAPRPGVARAHSLALHLSFGVGLYVSGVIVGRFVA